MKRGFTLIELLVVIVIIGILSSIILVNLSGSKAKARDGQRVSDLGQIQLALSLYYDRCGQYPPPHVTAGFGGGSHIDSSTLQKSNGCPSGITFSSFISQVPVPPGGGVPPPAYDYVTNNFTKSTDYVLHTSLEGQNVAQANSFLETNWSNYSWTSSSITCYDASSHPNDYCLTSH